MDYVETQGYCAKCRKETAVRYTIPSINTFWKILSFFSLGFWPLYHLRVKWRCSQCGGKADNESPHLVGRKMGGLKTIEYITRPVECETCKQYGVMRRRFPPASSLHQHLSFFTGGQWIFTWIQTGWQCRECGFRVETDHDVRWEIPLTSQNFCPHCRANGRLQRKVPYLPRTHGYLKTMTFGSWLFSWLKFGWQCERCGTGPDDSPMLMPGEKIEINCYCDKCNQEVTAVRKTPSFHFANRIMALLTFGMWASKVLKSGWRCSRCNGKVHPRIFEAEVISEKTETIVPVDVESILKASALDEKSNGNINRVKAESTTESN